MPDADGLAKVHIDLPHHWATNGESLWAKPLGADLFEIENVPFYAYGINFGDVVRATPDSPELKPEVREIVRPGGHTTIRLFFQEPSRDRQAELLASLSPFGAFAERATQSLVALDIAPGGDLGTLRKRLDEYEATGLLEYETCEARTPRSFDDVPDTNGAS